MFGRFRDILAAKELDESKKDVEFEKGDFLAIFIALASTMFPVLIGIFALIALLVWIIF
jgi:hypothetical protein